MTEKRNSGAAFDIRLIVRMIQLGSPYRAQMWSAIGLTILLTALAPLRPLLVQRTIDVHIADKDTQGVVLFSLIILAHILLQTLVLYAHTYTTSLIGQKVVKDLRNRVYRHILSLRKAFFDRSKVGTLVTRAISDIETVNSFFSQGFISIVGDVAQLVVVLLVMFVQDWRLSLISLSVFPVLLVASEFFRRGVRRSFQQVRTQVAKLNAFVQEHIVGMDVVQIFGKQEHAFKEFEHINRGHLMAFKRSIYHYSIYFPIVEVLNSIAIGLIIWWSARGMGVETSPGLIISFYMFISMIFRPIRMIADRFNTMQMGMVASERVFELLDDKKPVEPEGGLLRSLDGSIRFEDVWFAYKGEDYVLKGIDLEVEQGKSLALVGATGAGKSSIIQLISRFYEINRGRILIDGIPSTEYELASLRSQIGVVLQDVFLFAGSVEDNVRLKNEGVSREKMRAAAAEIGALDFIESLDQGWDQAVMERGSSLSVGQRQLISFLRAMVADPRILILDEATSSVDSETEELIQEATRKLMHQRTSIVIAHRLSTVREADTIVVLDRGRVVEKGTHQELLQNRSHYYDLVQKQFELS